MFHGWREVLKQWETLLLGFHLSDEQWNIFDVFFESQHPISIQALAGCSKTSTVVLLLALKGFLENRSSIQQRKSKSIFVTFTRAGRKEMAERYQNLMDKAVQMFPFHSINNTTTTTEINNTTTTTEINNTTTFTETIVTKKEQQSDIIEDDPVFRTLHSLAGSILTELSPLYDDDSSLNQQKDDDDENEKHKGIIQYEKLKQEIILEEDHDKSLEDVLRWLKSQPPCKPSQPGFRDIAIIEEAQDCCIQQWSFIKELKRYWPGLRLIMIGDIYQSIYLYNGADYRPFIQPSLYFSSNPPMIEHWKMLQLTINNRSHREIGFFLNVLLKQFVPPPPLSCELKNSIHIQTKKGPSLQKPILYIAESMETLQVYVFDIITDAIERNKKVWLLARNNYQLSRWQPVLMEKFPQQTIYTCLLTDQRLGISSMHKSKGLEQDIIILLDISDYVIKEDFNTFFVACSRPIEELYLTFIVNEKKKERITRFLPFSFFHEPLSVATLRCSKSFHHQHLSCFFYSSSSKPLQQTSSLQQQQLPLLQLPLLQQQLPLLQQLPLQQLSLQQPDENKKNKHWKDDQRYTIEEVMALMLSSRCQTTMFTELFKRMDLSWTIVDDDDDDDEERKNKNKNENKVQWLNGEPVEIVSSSNHFEYDYNLTEDVVEKWEQVIPLKIIHTVIVENMCRWLYHQDDMNVVNQTEIHLLAPVLPGFQMKNEKDLDERQHQQLEKQKNMLAQSVGWTRKQWSTFITSRNDGNEFRMWQPLLDVKIVGLCCQIKIVQELRQYLCCIFQYAHQQPLQMNQHTLRKVSVALFWLSLEKDPFVLQSVHLLIHNDNLTFQTSYEQLIDKYTITLQELYIRQQFSSYSYQNNDKHHHSLRYPLKRAHPTNENENMEQQWRDMIDESSCDHVPRKCTLLFTTVKKKDKIWTNNITWQTIGSLLWRSAEQWLQLQQRRSRYPKRKRVKSSETDIIFHSSDDEDEEKEKDDDEDYVYEDDDEDDESTFDPKNKRKKQDTDDVVVHTEEIVDLLNGRRMTLHFSCAHAAYVSRYFQDLFFSSFV
jgi:hypothetical protein